VTAQPVSPPERAVNGNGQCREYTCAVEFELELYSIKWAGTMQYPELRGFPKISGIEYFRVQLSPQMQEVWSCSTLISYGADAVIRCAYSGRFPVLKLAHLKHESKARLQHELITMQELNRVSLALPFYDSEPLSDADGVFGYRLEKLIPLPLDELNNRRSDIWSAVDRLHHAGFCHGDLTPSNVMKNAFGDIIIIDFAFAGRIGASIPDHIPSWIYQSSQFHTLPDLAALSRFFAFSWHA